jgi:hypothetical protein
MLSVARLGKISLSKGQKISEDVGISALSAREFGQLFMLMFKISPSNASYLLKRISEKLVFRKAVVLSLFITNPELYVY